jgi:hypothetical protein
MTEKPSRPMIRIFSGAWTRVIAACEALVLYVDSDDFNEDRLEDYENAVFEATINAVYGPAYWDYVNSKL